MTTLQPQISTTDPVRAAPSPSPPSTSAQCHGRASSTLGLALSLPDSQRASATTINPHSVEHNAEISLSPCYQNLSFQTRTIGPSPPAESKGPRLLTNLDTTTYFPHTPSPRSNPNSGLRLQTDIPICSVTSAADNNFAPRRSGEFNNNTVSKSIGVPIARAPSIKQMFANSIGSNGGSDINSAQSSPNLSAMTDVTPLPSPLTSGDSPGPWNRLKTRSRRTSREIKPTADAVLVTTSGESIASAIANQSKRRAYHGLVMNAGESGLNDPLINREKKAEGHRRNRSISEYTPDAVQPTKPRNQTLSGSHAALDDLTSSSMSPTDPPMRREPHLAFKRGIAPAPHPPTPPSSRAGGESSDSDSSLTHTHSFPKLSRKSRHEYFDAYTLNDQKRRRWRALKQLGEGTFSKVMLATSQVAPEDKIDEDDVFGQHMDGIVKQTPIIEPKKLVAIKICEHGPKGGASEERVEMSLKRELEIMKSIRHPSLVHLKAFSIEDTRAILVLSYCPGGDLFDVASENRDLLVPNLLRRIFAELVIAIQYLHERHIVHRDIKLENVLVNLPKHELAKDLDWATYPYSVITLTDLGLSRRVADDEKLSTRCGSDDYAAPEVIMGQPYDGRAVDAWSLGVLLYALLESRLPFDPTPGMSEGHKQRSKTSHRIARVEWRWIEYAGDEGDHEGNTAKFDAAGLRGAMDATENLLKRARSRWTIEKLAQESWARDAIQVEGGIKFRDEDIPEEVKAPSAL